MTAVTISMLRSLWRSVFLIYQGTFTMSLSKFVLEVSFKFIPIKTLYTTSKLSTLYKNSHNQFC